MVSLTFILPQSFRLSVFCQWLRLFSFIQKPLADKIREMWVFVSRGKCQMSVGFIAVHGTRECAHMSLIINRFTEYWIHINSKLRKIEQQHKDMWARLNFKVSFSKRKLEKWHDVNILLRINHLEPHTDPKNTSALCLMKKSLKWF